MTTEERLERLEQALASARRRHRSLVSMLVSVGVVIVFGALFAGGNTNAITEDDRTIADEIRSRRFILIDSTGRSRAVLGMTKEESPGLMLFDEKQEPDIFLGSIDHRGHLVMYDENHQETVSLHEAKLGPEFILRHEGKTRALMKAKTDSASLSLFDASNEQRAMVVQHGDSSAMMLMDQLGKTRLTLTAGDNGPSLELLDKDDVARAVIGVTRTVTPDGKAVTYPESSLLLFNPDGRVRWSAP